MSILVNKNTKVITPGMTGAAALHAAGVRVDAAAADAYITHTLCNCGTLS